MNKNKNVISYVEYGPTLNESKARIINGICKSIKIDISGNAIFYCNNKCSSYILNINLLS